MEPLLFAPNLNRYITMREDGEEFLFNPWHDHRQRYHQSQIPKKSGGFRVISKPHPLIYAAQEYLKCILTTEYKPKDCVMGFVRGKSVIDNAKVHHGRRYVFNTDIKDFFPSIGYLRVKKALTEAPFFCSEEDAIRIAGLCCMADPARKHPVLPQGAPTSPVISNIVCEGLDRKLLSLARQYSLRYTRYADDMTFSSNKDVFSERGEGSFFEIMKGIVASEGFAINDAKTRLQTGNQRQEVTGITVNRVPNVPKTFLRELRMLINIYEKYGPEHAYRSYCKAHFHSMKDVDCPVSPIENIIDGKLSYYKMIKGKDNEAYLNLDKRYKQAIRAIRRDSHPLRAYSVESFEAKFNTKVVIRPKMHCAIFANNSNSHNAISDYYAECMIDGRRHFIWISIPVLMYILDRYNCGCNASVIYDEEIIIEQRICPTSTYFIMKRKKQGPSLPLYRARILPYSYVDIFDLSNSTSF